MEEVVRVGETGRTSGWVTRVTGTSGSVYETETSADCLIIAGGCSGWNNFWRLSSEKETFRLRSRVVSSWGFNWTVGSSLDTTLFATMDLGTRERGEIESAGVATTVGELTSRAGRPASGSSSAVFRFLCGNFRRN